MKTLPISADLSLPLDIVTQAIAILAKRRAGKSYLARRLTEQLIHAGQQVVIVDPKGDWWGIRSAANGRGPGIKVVILGGEHGDVPLEVDSGELVATLAAEKRATMLLDLSEFRKHEVATFMTAFLENLYRLKAREVNRTPVMLMIDEADAIAPQRPMKGSTEERMLGAANDIVRRGGQRGIGCTMVSQRSAVLNKNVLTQVQLLVTLRTIAPQDLDAINEWVDVHGTREQRATLMASLPSLPVGEAWFWSPGWPTDAGIFQRSKVLPIETFDSGKTPESGVKREEPKRAADVDLDAFRVAMAATIEKAKAEDPRALRARIAELERELKAKPVAPAKAVRIEVPVIKDAQLKRLEALLGKVQPLIQETTMIAADINTTIARAMRGSEPALAAVVRDLPRLAGPPPTVRAALGAGQPKPGRAAMHPTTASGGPMSAMERKLLTALAQYQAGLTRPQVLTLARYADAGRISTAFARFRVEGWMVDQGELMVITNAGLGALGPYDRLPVGDKLIQHWVDKLDQPAKALFMVLVANRGVELKRAEILTQAKYADAGRISTAFAMLRRMKLIRDGQRGMALKEETFSS